MSNDTVLVTGAAGFIGSRLTEALLAEGRTVVAIDCFLPDLYPASYKKTVWRSLDRDNTGNLIRIRLDIRDDDFRILDKFNFVSIFNLAAMPGMSSDWSKSKPYYECNLLGLNRLVEYFRDKEIKSFVHASTSSVYGRTAIGDENQNLCPTSPYGVSKLAAEKLLIAYLEWHMVPVKILRYFSVYGPFQRPDMAFAKIIKALLTNTEFMIFGDGKQQRSNTYIDDVVSATVLADYKALAGDVMNVCGDETVSLNTAIAILEEVSGRKLKSRYLEGRTGDQKDTSGSNSFVKERLGWNSKVGIVEGLSRQFKASLSS